MKVPSLFPIFDVTNQTLLDGTAIKASSFCRQAIVSKPECLKHYASLRGKYAGFFQCPFGFTSRPLLFSGHQWVMTGVVAFPRFGTKEEREQAKKYSANHTSREGIEANISFLDEGAALRADVIAEAAKVLPQAFHELRKLNGAVLQHAEKEIKARGETPNLISIQSAAELMRNNFDILEALSNIDGMRALPRDATVNVFDLTYKMKRVLNERASDRQLSVNVTGVRAIIGGSQKSFPIVPAVLLENAIKYSEKGGAIRADIAARDGKAILTVENESASLIDPERCFERGQRFAEHIEGGGFGLFLAREIVHAHQGKIRCEMNGKIVRMIVELPLRTVIPGP